MERFILPLFCAACLFLTGCRVNRYYYVVEDPINLYEFSSFSGQPLLTAAPGDTVSATGTKGIQLGGSVPVEYRGYRFYAPFARARFLRIVKVRSKRDAFAPAIVYTSRLRYGHSSAYSGLPSNYGYTPSTGAVIHTGPRGGRYYINSHGNKTYVPRTSSSPSRSTSSYRSKSSGSTYRSRSSGSYRSSGGRGRH
ncbi:hypothetical protein GO755_04525 [Spirosoma sp. HMF4905]|uniref:Lipoprotein n=1 Tax=Spirosoma arboris TaxID=2682092 RepID=A0A7K1S650_9BACT|nr:hypothetical protein [Spirosoma arboris]MVM29287.1 hypothetical protein [Spirosoma arboris]